LDEGTEFVSDAGPSLLDTNILGAFFKASLYFSPNDTTVDPLFAELSELYPDDPALGSPYSPGVLGANSTDRFYGPVSQYKRAASIFGDIVFQSGRRALLDAYIKRDPFYPAYSYLFTQPTTGAPANLGISHGSEIAYVYGLYAQLNGTMGQTSAYMLTSWIAFANNLHPNRPFLPVVWPKYGPTRKSLQIGGGNFTVITDDYRKEGINFLQSAKWTNPLYI